MANHSSGHHDPNQQTKTDMQNARQNTTIDVNAIRTFLYENEENWKMHSDVVKVVSSDPAFDKSMRPYMTRSERYKRVLSMTTRLYELKKELNWSNRQSEIALTALDEPTPMTLHSTAFEPVVNLQGSPELIEKYGQLIAARGIIGCYLQTELGHGTNVPGLETTATFIPGSDEFEIHSPTLTATKWWIGALGRTATHGVVQARLILPGGKDMGPHLFFVQLRRLDNHQPLPGIIMGDIGPKANAGYTAVDNGFARFDHVRVPREHMLSKFAQVTKDGKYIQPPHSKLSYGGMLYIRVGMIPSGGWTIAKAAVIAIRYATVRRQGPRAPGQLEPQIITYPSVHYRLFPILSRAYVFIVVGRNLSKYYQEMIQRLSTGDTSLLAELHAQSSALKVLVSSLTIADIETARRSMGGHGFSAYAGLGRVYADYLPSATFEGDNYVLDQQVVRSALKALNNLGKSSTEKADAPSSRYLAALKPDATKPSVQDGQETWLKSELVVSLLQWRAALMVRDRSQSADQLDASVEARVSRAVAEAFVANQVAEILKVLPTHMNGASYRAVHNLYLLYLLTTVETALPDLFSFNVFPICPGSGRQSDLTKDLRLTIAALCRELLPHAIGLTDAFGLTDWELDSALGVYKGNVYEELMRRAEKEPLNQQPVPDGYDEFLKPMMERGQQLVTKGKL